MIRSTALPLQQHDTERDPSISVVSSSSSSSLRELRRVLDITWKGTPPTRHCRQQTLVHMSLPDTFVSLFLDDHQRTPLELLSGLPSWSPPSSADSQQVIEPMYSTEDQTSLRELRIAVAVRVSQSLTPSNRLKQAYSDFHWRDIYTQCAQHTTVIPTAPDPRSSASSSARSVDTMADYHVHQFLAACSGDMVEATTLLCDYLYWWSTFGVDDLCAQPVCPFADLASVFHAPRLHGVDQFGRPLLVGTPGAIPVQAFIDLQLPREWSWILQTYLRERIDRLLIDASALRRVRITQFSAIADLSGISLAHGRLLPWATGGSYVAAHFYPETTGAIVVVNAPFFFPLIWKIVQRMVVEHTRKKITVLGSRYQPALNTIVGAAAVPREWGGTCAKCLQ